MGGDNPKMLGRLVKTPNLFNGEYCTQFMNPKLPTTTQKNKNGLNSLLRPNCGSREFKIYVTLFLAPITTVLSSSYEVLSSEAIGIFTNFLIHSLYKTTNNE